ncbi:hypothetical protein K2X33_05845 [bacterium]|nr:hypothetical protein [bacterium]
MRFTYVFLSLWVGLAGIACGEAPSVADKIQTIRGSLVEIEKTLREKGQRLDKKEIERLHGEGRFRGLLSSGSFRIDGSADMDLSKYRQYGLRVCSDDALVLKVGMEDVNRTWVSRFKEDKEACGAFEYHWYTKQAEQDRLEALARKKGRPLVCGIHVDYRGSSKDYLNSGRFDAYKEDDASMYGDWDKTYASLAPCEGAMSGTQYEAFRAKTKELAGLADELRSGALSSEESALVDRLTETLSSTLIYGQFYSLNSNRRQAAVLYDTFTLPNGLQWQRVRLGSVVEGVEVTGEALGFPPKVVKEDSYFFIY